MVFPDSWWVFFFLFLTLQYCIGFAIYQHESTTGIHVFPILNPPPSTYHPSGSSQCTSPMPPVLCLEPGLVTCLIYDIIHVSMPFSQIIPPSPSPTESKRPFFTSVSLLLSHIQGYCYHLSKFYICVSVLYWCFSFWLTSLCIGIISILLSSVYKLIGCLARSEYSVDVHGVNAGDS